MLVGLAEAKQPWFWQSAVAIAGTLLAGNLLVLISVYVHGAVQAMHRRRDVRIRAHVEELLADPESRRLIDAVARFNRPERQVAAFVLIERLDGATDDERARLLAAIRDAGAVDRVVRATRRRLPWRRALAIRTLGRIDAPEAVPALIARLSDRSRYVRECAVRALGRTRDPRGLPLLGDRFRTPGSVGAGVVYDALVTYGPSAEPIFAGALRSELVAVRVASCFGVAALSEPEQARTLLEPLLSDPSARVRAAAAESIGRFGGSVVPESLARASRDGEPAVRTAAAGALGSFDDPRAVELLSNALLDPDWDTVVRAGESLVRLGRPDGPWPVERARILASLGTD